ncbi:MAG TPA: site-2 protease family protein [Candidatus Solibacter sp.]|nr:site-2 protease family protein [Candidatus Solibacter sp.]
MSQKVTFKAGSDVVRACRRCSCELPTGALVCENCHALVYSEQLDRIAAEAKHCEESGDLGQAREQWMMGLHLLPADSKQALWIQDHVRTLEVAVAPESAPLSNTNALVRASRNPWQRGIVSLAGLLSFVAFAAIYSRESGAQFGIGFAVIILIHEMGHYIDIRRRGLPADMPIFLPGLGAYVRWRALGVSLETRAAISLAGPMAGFLAALGCALIWHQTQDPYWLVLARVGAALNLLNLIPVWILDGGQAVLALDKSERIALLAISVTLWVIVRQNVLLLVAAGAAFRAFYPSDLPARPSRGITAYFMLVIAMLSLILRLLPGHDFGVQ